MQLPLRHRPQCKTEWMFFGLPTQQKTHNLFWPDENSIEQCFAAHIVQGC